MYSGITCINTGFQRSRQMQCIALVFVGKCSIGSEEKLYIFTTVRRKKLYIFTSQKEKLYIFTTVKRKNHILSLWIQGKNPIFSLWLQGKIPIYSLQLQGKNPIFSLGSKENILYWIYMHVLGYLQHHILNSKMMVTLTYWWWPIKSQ